MNRDKKILFVVGGSIVSGAEIVMLNVMSGLLHAGYGLRCVANGWSDGDFIARLQEIGVPSYAIKLGFVYIKKLLWTFFTLIYLPSAWFKYWRIRNEFKPDISYHVTFRTVFMLFPFLNQNKILLHVEDCAEVNKINRFFYSVIDKKVTRYIACSEFIKRHLQDLGIRPEKIKVVLNGVKINNPTANIAKGDKNGHSPIRIGVAGQLLPQKGHWVLIEALDMIKKEGRDFVLKIYGKGDAAYIKRLKSKISLYNLESNVEWMGFIKDQGEIYSNIDIAVVPSCHNEPLSLSVIEPAFFGLPVIASNKGGIPEIIIDRQTGLLFEAGNAVDLYSKLRLLMEDGNLRERLAQNAKDRAGGKFTTEIMCKQIEEIL
jgi:glycosyltransferase involved in cell wall biosynthesis